jgi:hypothetical protein
MAEGQGSGDSFLLSVFRNGSSSALSWIPMTSTFPIITIRSFFCSVFCSQFYGWITLVKPQMMEAFTQEDNTLLIKGNIFTGFVSKEEYLLHDQIKFVQSISIELTINRKRGITKNTVTLLV